MTVTLTASAVRQALRGQRTAGKATASARYFKTGPGEYGEGDVFLGVSVPAQRQVARTFTLLSLEQTLELLCSPVHEERLTALFILVRQFKKGDAALRQRLVDAYLAHTQYVNNWDLVDSSAPEIMGTWLLTHERAVLYRLVKSPWLWDRRIAIIATATLIRSGQYADTLQLARLLLADEHDLIHKATGWMLREVGKHGGLATLVDFLSQYAARMPRTALRYAIEHFSPQERARWLSQPRTRR